MWGLLSYNSSSTIYSARAAVLYMDKKIIITMLPLPENGEENKIALSIKAAELAEEASDFQYSLA